MNQPITFKSGRSKLKPSARRLSPVFHPHWSSIDDHDLMLARHNGQNFTAIAQRMGRTRIAVEQRFHRLRVIPNVIKLLESYGLTNRPYTLDGGGHG